MPGRSASCGARKYVADPDGERGEQLGDGVVQQQRGGGHLAEAEVDDPALLPPVVDEEVGLAQVAVGDPVAAQDGGLLPDPVEQAVADLAVVAVEGQPFDE